MPFIPHTETDVAEMLKSIGVGSIDQLFDEIPAQIRAAPLAGAVPVSLPEMAVARLMSERAASDGQFLNFIGAGAYEHHVPAAVWQVATRGEFYSAYTPYQAEASQGTLQVMYEYQSMMTALTGMEVSNASLYDGASALAEAVLMAVRAHKQSRRVLAAATLHPHYSAATRAIVGNQDIALDELPYQTELGTCAAAALHGVAAGQYAALVIAQPNFFGALEAVDALTDAAQALGMLVIAVVNPLALAVLKPPGSWGKTGADIVVGDGQPLGVPLSGGGPYFGFMCCKQALVRQMPGRIVGRTVDLEGKTGYTLTLQAREQHIRRSKATSNICTNQGLAVTAATIYMALLGAHGLAGVARRSHANCSALVQALSASAGVSKRFSAPFFHECVLRLPRDAESVLEKLRARSILGGVALGDYFPELGDAILVCATETKTAADIQRYATALAECLT